jgi:tellurite resistance protein TehA-like permease
VRATLPDRTRTAVEGLTPGYFALVMATGIVSVGMQLKGFDVLGDALLVLCLAAFVVLVLLNGWRLARYPRSVAADFLDPRRAFGFFTFVAGFNVVAIRVGMDGHHVAQAVLLGCAGAGWVVLGYVVPWTAVLGHRDRPVVEDANGTWFIWVVASQSVATCAANLESVWTGPRTALALLAVVSWSVGIFLYAAAGILVALRLMLYPFGPEELTPPYWVAMGALAITVVAGARIVEMSDAPVVHATRGLAAGVAVVFWAFATWLIPVLVAAGVWRHVARRVPLHYDATLWSVIFPLGMYAVAGIFLGRADGLPLVEAIGSAGLWVAFAAWALVLVAMLRHLHATIVRSPRPPAGSDSRSDRPSAGPRSG